MRTKVDKITKILAEWNPLGVPHHIAETEYSGYSGMIYRNAADTESLFHHLERLLVIDMGIPFDVRDEHHRRDLEAVCIKIYDAMNSGTQHGGG